MLEKLELDHLVIAARTLDEGVGWCEATLGVAPGPGGKHDFMGTHNRLLRIDSARFARAYLEIIAIDPAAEPPRWPRWFDLDAEATHAALANGPRLWHWVARTANLDQGLAALGSLGIDGGQGVDAQRATSGGMLRWRIGIRADGARNCEGALPTLIEWTGTHPVDAMPTTGVQLEAVELFGISTAFAAWWPEGVSTGPAGASAGQAGTRIEARFATPRGTVRVSSRSEEN